MMKRVSNGLQTRRRVGLDAHLLSLSENYRGAGINGYIYQLLRHLPAAGRPDHYIAYLCEPRFSGEGIPTLEIRQSRWNTRRPWSRIVWEQTRLAQLSRRLNLLHGLAFALPLAAACPSVVTIHDLSFLRYPSAFRPFNRHYLTWITRASTRRAARVIAVSESTRRDVIERCGVPAERVTVVPNGVTEDFYPAPAGASAAFRRQKGLPDHFLLFLGTLEPRKNLVRLVEAYALWRRSGAGGRRTGDDCGTRLVIAGAKGWYYEQIFARVAGLGLKDDVLFPGFIPAGELPSWYRAADAFVYPSLFEGFGLPVLEAMACGTPTITSATSALPEVAGEAALLVDPQDTAALAAAIDQVLTDRQCAATLRAAGPQQAARFTWARTAAETSALYGAILEGSQ